MVVVALEIGDRSVYVARQLFDRISPYCQGGSNDGGAIFVKETSITNRARNTEVSPCRNDIDGSQIFWCVELSFGVVSPRRDYTSGVNC